MLCNNANGSFLFLLNHDTQTHEVTLNRIGRDILTGTEYKEGDTLRLAGKTVAGFFGKGIFLLHPDPKNIPEPPKRPSSLTGITGGPLLILQVPV